jgi:hypothetical protein
MEIGDWAATRELNGVYADIGSLDLGRKLLHETLALPKLHGAAVRVLGGGVDRRFVALAVELDDVTEVAVLAPEVKPIVGHAPPLPASGALLWVSLDERSLTEVG